MARNNLPLIPSQPPTPAAPPAGRSLVRYLGWIVLLIGLLAVPGSMVVAHFWFSVTSPLDSSAPAGERTAEPSPHLIDERLGLLAAAGLALPARIDSEDVITVDGAEYRLWRYTLNGEPKMQIIHAGRLLTASDRERGFDVVSASVWQVDDFGLGKAEWAGLRALSGDLTAAGQTYAPYFAAAEAMAPLLELVDDLKDRPIAGIPDFSPWGIPIIQIRNTWDLICTIPLNVTDSCLLEPALRAYHAQATEVEQRLGEAAVALEALNDLGARRAAGEVVSGRDLRAALDGASTAFDNLNVPLAEMTDQAALLQAMTQTSADFLANRRWNRTTQALLDALALLIPGYSIDPLITPVVARLRDLDSSLDGVIRSGDAAMRELDAAAGVLRAASVHAANQTRLLGAQWAPPHEDPAQ